MTAAEMQRYLYLHDKHLAAYAAQEEIPQILRTLYITRMAHQRADIERKLKDLEEK